MIILEQINNLSTSSASSSCSATVEPDRNKGRATARSCFLAFEVKEISISPHISLWICMLLKCLYPPKITVSKVSTKESHPRLSSPKITHSLTPFVSLNHVLVLPFNLDFNPALRCRLPRCLPPKLQSKIYSLFNKLTSGWRRRFSLLLDSEASGDGGRERGGDGEDKKTANNRKMAEKQIARGKIIIFKLVLTSSSYRSTQKQQTGWKRERLRCRGGKRERLRCNNIF